MENSYDDYLNSSKELFKQLFGDELFNKLENTPLKSIDYKGLDISCVEITAVFPNIKERFSKNGIGYFDDGRTTLLNLYIQSIFHLGYNQSYQQNKERNLNMEAHSKFLMECIKDLKKELKKLNGKNKK